MADPGQVTAALGSENGGGSTSVRDNPPLALAGADAGGSRHDERVIVRGEGAYVWDEHGNRLLDATASLWYCNVGHGRAEIADAVDAQMRVLETYHSLPAVRDQAGGRARRPARRDGSDR